MSIFKNRNFMLHWASVTISQIGSFFAIIALPWLVLSTNGDNPLMMSTTVALSSLPYAVFILFGGALTDRISPLRLLLVTRSAFVLVMSSLAVLVYSGFTPFWLLASYALVLGTLGAFGIPAAKSMLPGMLPGNLLAKGNGIILGTIHLAQIFGPMLAGWMLWLGRTLHGVPKGEVDYVSLAFAFGFHACASLLAIGLMLLIRLPKKAVTSVNRDLLHMVWDGLRFCWQETGIRTVLAYLVLISFFLQGPLAAILPILAKVRLGLSEAEYGSLYAMIGIGTLIGAGIAVMTKPDPQILGRWVLCCDCVSGLGLYLLGHTTDMVSSSALLLMVGSMNGFIMIAGVTWFQQRTPSHYMGRVMSILMFAVLGLVPISATLTGFLIRYTSLDTVFAFGGVVIMFCAGGGLLIPAIRNMGRETPAWKAVKSGA